MKVSLRTGSRTWDMRKKSLISGMVRAENSTVNICIQAVKSLLNSRLNLQTTHVV